MVDTQKIVIIDNGSECTRVGHGDLDVPNYLIISAVRYDLIKNNGKDYAIAHDVFKDDLTTIYPIERGIISDWDAMEKLWELSFAWSFYKPEEWRVLLTDSPSNPKKNREKMIEIMIEKFKVPAIYIENQAVLSLYGTGRTSGIAVESGHGITHIVPISEGVVLSKAMDRMDVAGQDVTDFLLKLLVEKDKVASGINKVIVGDIKKRFCYASMQYDYELTHEDNDINETYNLPDGKAITIGKEKFRCTEPLFQPSLLGHNSKGIHERIHDCTTKCREEGFNLNMDVILSGGNTLIHHMDDRLRSELVKLSSGTVRYKVISPTLLERAHLSWMGGAMLALRTWDESFITKDAYEELGVNVVNKLPNNN